MVDILDDVDADIHVFDPVVAHAVVQTIDVDAINPGVTLQGGLAAASHPSGLIASDWPAGNLHLVDPATGIATLVAALGVTETGVATVDGLMLVADNNAGSGIEPKLLRPDGSQLRTWSSPWGYGAIAGDDSVAALDPPLFADGFESGGTSAWSLTFP